MWVFTMVESVKQMLSWQQQGPNPKLKKITHIYLYISYIYLNKNIYIYIYYNDLQIPLVTLAIWGSIKEAILHTDDVFTKS